MSTSHPRTWDKPTVEVSTAQLTAWKQALVDAKGNVTKAAELAGIARSYAMELNKKYDLREFAAGLRLQAGGTRSTAGERKGTVTGRPRKG